MVFQDRLNIRITTKISPTSNFSSTSIISHVIYLISSSRSIAENCFILFIYFYEGEQKNTIQHNWFFMGRKSYL